MMIENECNGDPSEPKSQGGEGEEPDVTHLNQTAVKRQTQTQTQDRQIIF